MSDTSPPKPAFVEDVDDATGEADEDTRKFANSGAKRSNQSLKKEKTTGPTSDSGVSGFSHASQTSSHHSRASGGSARTPKPVKPSHRVDEPQATVKRRSTVSERERPKESSRREHHHRSPERSTRRAESKAQRPESGQYTGQYLPCNDPNCHEPDCGTTPRKHRSRPSLDTYGSFPPQYPQPSPSGSHPPVSYQQHASSHGQPIGVRPRGMSTASRPASFGYYPTNPPQLSGNGPHPGLPSGYQGSHPNFDPFAAAYVQPHMTRSSFMPPSHVQSVSASPMKPARPGLPHAMTDGLDYSTRATMQSSQPQKAYSIPLRTKPQEPDDHDITTRPTHHTGLYRPPGAFPELETPESSPERYSMATYQTDRERMPPPSSVPDRRPSLRKSATTSDASYQRSRRSPERPIIHRYEQSYESASDNYDTDRTQRSNQAVVAGTRRPSGRSERSYNTYTSDPVGYGKRADRAYPPDRRTSDYGGNRLRQKENKVEDYLDSMRGFRDDPSDFSAEWVKKETRQSLNAGHTPSAVSGSSHRSHRSRHSISSRTSNKGGTLIQFNGTTVDVPEGHHVTVDHSPESGRHRLIINDGRDQEKRYAGEGSVRSSAQASSGSRRDRSNTDTTRGRRNSIRPDSRRRSDYTGDGGFEAAM